MFFVRVDLNVYANEPVMPRVIGPVLGDEEDLTVSFFVGSPTDIPPQPNVELIMRQATMLLRSQQLDWVQPGLRQFIFDLGGLRAALPQLAQL